jgi:hypothetical protein
MVGGLFGRIPQARHARLTGAAKYPAGARPSKCIIIIMLDPRDWDHAWCLIVAFDRLRLRRLH